MKKRRAAFFFLLLLLNARRPRHSVPPTKREIKEEIFGRIKEELVWGPDGPFQVDILSVAI